MTTTSTNNAQESSTPQVKKSPWRAIDSAPTDKPIILFTTAGQEAEGCFNFGEGEWEVFLKDETGEIVHTLLCEATHWRPKSKPPEDY